MSDQPTALRFDRQQVFRIDTAQQTGGYVIRIEGELDAGGCRDLELALAAAEQAQAGRIILDLEELTFIDAAGLTTLLEASRRSASNGNRLQMTRGNGHPADMFRLTGLDLTLPLTDPALCPSLPQPGIGADHVSTGQSVSRGAPT